LTNMEQVDLSDFFSTKYQAADFSARLSVIKEKLYEINFNLDKGLAKQFGSAKKDKFLTLLRNQGVEFDSAEELSITISRLQEHISKMPTVTLTLAIEPEEETLKATSDWFMLNLNKQVLIEFQVDPNIIAGAVVSYQGRQLDASIKQFFDKICTEALDMKN
jgi:F0F1-type ATP synthase delta subunit